MTLHQRREGYLSLTLLHAQEPLEQLPVGEVADRSDDCQDVQLILEARHLTIWPPSLWSPQETLTYSAASGPAYCNFLGDVGRGQSCRAGATYEPLVDLKMLCDA